MTYLSIDQRIGRLHARIDEYALWSDRATVRLDGWSCDGRPHAVGAPWPTLDGTVHFAHPEIEVPADWPLEAVRLRLDLGGEGLVRIASGDATRRYGLDPYHTEFPVAGHGVAVEAACVARLPFGEPRRDARLEWADLVLVETGLVRLLSLVGQVLELARAFGGYEVDPAPRDNFYSYRPHPDHSRPHDVVEPLLTAAEQALGRLRWPTATGDVLARIAGSDQSRRVWRLPDAAAAAADGAPPPLTDDARASIDAATAWLKDELKRLKDRHPQYGSVALSGHAHIDLAWLWPIAETRRKLTRTFNTVADLMERYPGFRFNQSTAQYYAWIEEDDPALFARIREHVAAGQWEPVGTMWVEPDLNMPAGESLVRQLLYGARYFDAAFGAERRSRVNWLPDTFGFSPVLPQLLRLAGMEAMFTHKTNWSERNRLESDLFWWEGLDGSRVLVHTFDNPAGGYNGRFGPRAAVDVWRNYRDKARVPETLLTFGYGDGGGGPTAGMLDRIGDTADLPAMPAVRQVNVSDWFAGLPSRLRAGDDFPVWVGELYLEFHRGTLTTQARTKVLHRCGERALVTAEVLGGLARMLGAPQPGSLEPVWRVLLRNEFHDILPGSSIREVHEEAEAELASVAADAGAEADRHLDAIASHFEAPGGTPGVLVVNPDLSPRPLRLHAADDLPGGQAVDGGTVLAGAPSVPGLSVATFDDVAAVPGLAVGTEFLENDVVRVELAPDGTFASVFDKRAGRECLAGRGNRIFAYDDRPRRFDAWDIEEDHTRSGEEIVAAAAPEVVERGPHRVAVRVERTYGASRITQTIRLWSNSPRIDIATEIDWHERHVLLKARFPLAIRADRALFECAFGVIPRPTHRNRSWDKAQFEVAAHRFVDLAEEGFGVALLNDGRYGQHAIGNELGISLLRSPVYPDLLADEGAHSFTYALLPHAGTWLSGGVLAEAEDLNRPLIVRPLAVGEGRTWSPVTLAGPDLGLGALKPAEDGNGLILRTYEPAGARGPVEVDVPDGWALGGEVNLLEETVGAADTRFGPFQVRSWRLVPER